MISSWKGDKMGMANSLEVRVPFLDKEVMEVAQSLPLKYKIDAPRTKIALRAAANREIRSYTAEKKKLDSRFQSVSGSKKTNIITVSERCLRRRKRSSSLILLI